MRVGILPTAMVLRIEAVVDDLPAFAQRVRGGVDDAAIEYSRCSYVRRGKVVSTTAAG